MVNKERKYFVPNTADQAIYAWLSTAMRLLIIFRLQVTNGEWDPDGNLEDSVLVKSLPKYSPSAVLNMEETCDSPSPS